VKFVLFTVIAVALVGLRIVRHRRRARANERTVRGPSAARQYVEAKLGDVGLVAARELRERTRGRIFRVGTLLILAAVAAAIVIPTINKTTTPSAPVGILGGLNAPLRQAITAAAGEVPVTVHLVNETELARAKEALRSGQIDVVIVDGRRIIVDQAISSTNSSTTAQLAQDLSVTLSDLATVTAARLSAPQIAQLAHPVVVPITGLTPTASKGQQVGTSIIGLILVFVLLSQYSAWILIGVAEEKSSRVVEVLLATVRTIHLLAGKVLGIGTAALAQAGLIVIFALLLAKAVGSNVLKGTAPIELASSLLWLVLGYAFYCWVYAAAGSLTERQSQLQSLSFPLSLPMLVGYIISITTAASGNASSFFKVLAYLPPTAPFAMPVLVGLGQATWWEFVLSAAISLVATVGVARVAAGIYQRAILRTGRGVKLREVLPTAR